MSVDNVKIEAIKDKLRKLIAKEASAREIGNLAEAEAFASKIQELMIDYELEMDDIMGGAHRRIYSVGEEVFDTEPLTQRHESNWVAILYCTCGPIAFTKAVYYSEMNEKVPMKVKIFGDATNREMLHYIVAQLSVKLRALSRKSFADYKKAGGTDKRNTYVRSFLKGANIGIRQKLREDKEKAAQANNQVQGLILNKDASIQKYLNDHGYRFTSLSMKLGSSGSGYGAGVSAGRSIDINKGVGNGSGPSKRLG